MLVGLGDILGVGLDPSGAGWCNGGELQALESDGHGSIPGFASLLMGQAWTSDSTSLEGLIFLTDRMV